MITMDRVRELAGERHRPVVTSCYIDVDGRRNPRAVDVERHLNTLRREVEQRLEEDRELLPHDYRTSVRSDLERIERFVNQDFDRSNTRGLAIFACSAEGFFEAVGLPFEVHDEVALDRRPRLRQLELGLAEQRTYGVALVDRERVRLFVADATGMREIGSKSERIGSRQEQGGWAGPRIQRHADEIGRRHLEEFAATTREVFREQPVDALIIGGTTEDIVEFRNQLDQDIAARVEGTVAAGTKAPPDEVREAVFAEIERLREERHRALLERLDAALAGGEPAARGLQEVIRALMEKRIEVLVVGDGFTRSGWRCTACDALSLQGGACPTCGGVMEEVDDIVEEVIVRAAGMEAQVERADRERAERFSQIAAILRW